MSWVVVKNGICVYCVCAALVAKQATEWSV